MRTMTGGFTQQGVTLYPEYSIFEPATPGELDEGTASIVVGTKFLFTLTNNILWAIKWYRTEEFPGVSEIALWEGTELLSGPVTVTGETSDGWQIMYLDPTWFLTADTIYTVAALYPNGGHRFAANFLASAYVNGPLEAVSNTTSANGVYALSSTMVCPTTSAAETCFFIDVLIS